VSARSGLSDFCIHETLGVFSVGGALRDQPIIPSPPNLRMGRRALVAAMLRENEREGQQGE